MEIKQGDIYWASLNPVKGHEQAGFRPVLVMQNDILNQNLNTVLVAPLSTNLKAKGRITTYFLPKRQSGLKKDSVVLLFQIRTLDQTRLIEKAGTLPEAEFSVLKSQLNFIF